MAGSSAVVIPARMAATRLPGKPLLSKTGKPLIQHVWESACQARLPDQILIATDDDAIHKAAQSFGARSVMTLATHQSGTERVIEAADLLDSSVQIVVNVQGDEPEIEATSIDTVIRLLKDDPSSDIATLATPLHDPDQIENPACVKVTLGHDGAALYFSRSPIPYVRNPDSPVSSNQPKHFQHLGLYAYRRRVLKSITRLPESILEVLEGLEQLRWLQSGLRIKVGVIPHAAKGIDTPEDYDAFVERCRFRYTGNHLDPLSE